MAGYYDTNLDYSKELQRTDLSTSDRTRLEQERQNKIDDKYKGNEPNMIGSNQKFSDIYTGSGGGSSSSKGSSSNGGSSNSGSSTPSYTAPAQTQTQTPALNQYGFRDNFDYSVAINAAKAQGLDTTQLEKERAKKIEINYGNAEPNMYGSDKKYSELTGANSSWQNQDIINNAVVIANTTKNNSIKAQMEKEAQAGNWDKVGALVNELAVPDGRYGGYDMTYANQVWGEVAKKYGYNAKEYYDSQYDKAYGAGSAAVFDATGGAVKTAKQWSELTGGAPIPKPTGTNGVVQTIPLPGNSVIGGPGAAGGGVSGSSGSGNYAPGTTDVYTPGNMGDYLNQWYQNAQQQQQNTIDFGTNQAILELLRNKQDAEAQYQEQRNQIAIDEAKAKDNQALYAEARGDKGGIGAAQYDAIMNTAAQNRLQVNSAQTKLATDTSRQIADLRAQGEYEKADALLTLSQQYLSQLMSLEQWAAEYNLSVAQFNASLQQWQAEYDLKVADLLGSYNGQQTLSAKQFAFNQQQYADEQQAAQEKKLASAGEILLAAGIPPSPSQLAAMGMTRDEADAYILAQKVAAAAKTKSSSSGGGGGDKTIEEEKPRLSASAAESALTEKENYSTSTLSAYDYYYGDGSAINVLMENNDAVGKLVRNLRSIEGEGNVNARRYASIKQYYEKGYFNSAVYAYLLAYFGVDSTEG